MVKVPYRAADVGICSTVMLTGIDILAVQEFIIQRDYTFVCCAFAF